MSDLNPDQDEARALHRIVRAMHDGECPRCHQVSGSAQMRIDPAWASRYRPAGWKCPTCGFFISQAEAEDVFQIFAPFMKRNLAIFEKWRARRGT
jgi:hypothetical protein